jgi:hypothetical protein
MTARWRRPDAPTASTCSALEAGYVVAPSGAWSS